MCDDYFSHPFRLGGINSNTHLFETFGGCNMEGSTDDAMPDLEVCLQSPPLTPVSLRHLDLDLFQFPSHNRDKSINRRRPYSPSPHPPPQWPLPELPACAHEQHLYSLPSPPHTPIFAQRECQATARPITPTRKVTPAYAFHPVFLREYTPDAVLGGGAYGVVLSVTQRISGIQVALKMIDKTCVNEWVPDKEQLFGGEQVPLEVSILRRIDHPGIVKFVDLFEDDDWFYLVQELHGCCWSTSESNTFSLPLYAPSTTEPANVPRPNMGRRGSHDLFDCLEQLGSFAESRAKKIFGQIVDAVAYLDGMGITHGDIKDENLVIDEHYQVKLVDFGSATCRNMKRPAPFLTAFTGTESYASSEILRGRAYRAPNAEIWSLGVLLCILLAGNPPFADFPSDAIAGNISKPLLQQAEVSPVAFHLLTRCLDINPETRATITEVQGHAWVKSHRPVSE